MTKPAIPQSLKRFTESLASKFSEIEAKKQFLFIKSSSDEGVIRNRGRNGSRFAPQALLTAFKAMTWNHNCQDFRFIEVEVGNQEAEKLNFNQAQKLEAQKISEVLLQHKTAHVCHVGGGHDHIYPLLLALKDQFKKIIVINLDAHADTRTDSDFHSGTPFRQISQDLKEKFKLFQVGLHPFTNSVSTLSPIDSEMRILWRNEVSMTAKVETYFAEIKKTIDQDTCLIFSLDADVMASHLVPGVSAVNHNGLTMNELKNLWKHYLDIKPQHASILGIYELNPVYDSLSCVSMKTIASFLYEILD